MNLVIDSTLRVSVLLVIAFGMMRLLRRQSAALRHWVLSAAVACAAVSPLLGMVVPSWSVGIESFSQRLNDGPSDLAVTTSTVFEEPSPGASPAPSETPIAKTAAPAGLRWPALLAPIWLAGVSISLLILAVGLLRLAWLASRARPIESGRWMALLDEISRTTGLRRSVRLLHSDHPALLVTWGLVRPKVMLPAPAFEWSDDRARIVLQHELAHVSRGDWALQMTAEALRIVYWFNPLIWIACARLRQESEQACDDAVLGGGVEGPDYATHLLDLARSLNARRRAWLPAPAMARPSSLEGRIKAMLNARVNRNPLTTSVRVAIILAMLGIAMPIASAQNAFFTFGGSIVDQTNRVLADTPLLLSNVARQAKYEVRTDGAGRFEFVGLPNGTYVLQVNKPGFAPLKEDVRIDGRNVERTFQLEVGSLEETIRVVGDRTQTPAVRRTDNLQERAERVQEQRQRRLDSCKVSDAGPIGGQIVPPLKLVDVKPIYPTELKASGVGGVVTMDVVIGTDGNVKDVQVVDAPHPDLGSAAVEAVRQWQFTSTLLNCAPIEVRMKVTTSFVVE